MHRISLESNSPIHIVNMEQEEHKAPQRRFAQLDHGHRNLNEVRPARPPSNHENGFTLSWKAVALLGLQIPAYMTYQNFPQFASELGLTPAILAGGLATIGATGAALTYSPGLREATANGLRWTARQAWNWGVAAPVNLLRNQANNIAQGISWGLGVTRRTLSAIGAISTDATSGTIKVASTIIGETGNALSTGIKKIGHIIPELTGTSIIAATYYFGIPFLRSQFGNQVGDQAR